MRRKDSRGLATALTAVIVGIAAYVSVAGDHGIWAPNSLAVVLPGIAPWSLGDAWFSDSWEVIPFAISFALPIAVVAFIWLRPLRRGIEAVPLRSFVLFGFLLLLVPIYFAGCWAAGVQYQGEMVTTALAIEAGTFLLLLGVAGLIAHLRPGWWVSLVFQGGQFLFLAWCAFPWLGETP